MTTTPPPPRSARRNHPSLSHLHLAPLSTFPEDVARADENSASGTRTPPWRQSYIAGRSAPTTPGILSRSPSRSRAKNLANSKSFTQLAYNDDLETGMKRSKPRKSSNKKRDAASHTRDGGDDWLFRAGTAISEETRFSKGQAWLVNRASSTNLVDQGHSSEEDDDTRAGGVPRILSPDTDRRQFQRSHRGSRNGSRSASRTDLFAMTLANRSSRGSRTSMHSADEMDDYFGPRRDRPAQAGVMGPDFVDDNEIDADAAADDDDDSDDSEQHAADEAEIARLARERGGAFDRFLSWALFPDENEVDPGDEEDEEDVAQQRAAQQALGKLRNTKVAAAKAPAVPQGPRAIGKDDEAGVSGWTDAAWLLSVASKVIF